MGKFYKFIASLVIALATVAANAADTDCASFDESLALNGRYWFNNKDNPYQGQHLEVIPFSTSSYANVFVVNNTGTTNPKNLPQQFQLVVLNERAHPWAVHECKAFFKFNEPQSSDEFNSIRIRTDGAQFSISTLNSNACQGWFCTPKEETYLFNELRGSAAIVKSNILDFSRAKCEGIGAAVFKLDKWENMYTTGYQRKLALSNFVKVQSRKGNSYFLPVLASYPYTRMVDGREIAVVVTADVDGRNHRLTLFESTGAHKGFPHASYLVKFDQIERTIRAANLNCKF